MPIGPKTELPLDEGILRWCDAALVASAQDAEARAMAIKPPSCRPSSFDGAGRDEIGNWGDMREAEQRIRAAAVQAWNRVFADLRQWLTYGELLLTGVQARSNRGVDRVSLIGS